MHTLPETPAFCSLAANVGDAKRIASYAHKLSYTSFAPQKVGGQNLFRPPAPQTWDFRASVLHHLAGGVSLIRRPRSQSETLVAVSQSGNCCLRLHLRLQESKPRKYVSRFGSSSFARTACSGHCRNSLSRADAGCLFGFETAATASRSTSIFSRTQCFGVYFESRLGRG